MIENKSFKIKIGISNSRIALYGINPCGFTEVAAGTSLLEIEGLLIPYIKTKNKLKSSEQKKKCDFFFKTPWKEK